MNRARPTVATLVLAVIGMVTAVQILRKDHHKVDVRPTRVVVVTAQASAPPDFWNHRPVSLRSAEPATWIADSARLLAPRPTVAPTGGLRMLTPQPSALAMSAVRPADIAVAERGAATGPMRANPVQIISDGGFGDTL